MKKYILLIAALVVLSTSGCKNFLDINHNPNDPSASNITMDLILPAVEYDMVNNHCNSTYSMQLAQYLTKTGEFSGNYTFLTGDIMPQDLDSWWSTYYSLIRNINLVREKAVENNDKAFEGVALVLTAINYQRMVDIWGNVPYSQACLPLDYEQPVYDDAKTIYTDLVAKVDTAINCFSSVLGQYDNSLLKRCDILGRGDLNLWIKMANSVKLRLLMRMSNVQDVKAQLAGIEGKCLSPDDNVDVDPGYYVENGKMNIFYESYGWDKNGGLNTNLRQYSPTTSMLDMLRDNNDPRLRVYADPRTKIGEVKDKQGNVDKTNADYAKYNLENEWYIGIPFGQSDPPRQIYTSMTGTGILAGSSDKANGRLRPNTFMTGAESTFLLAEAALRGLISGGDAKAKALYEAAVLSAMERHEKALKDPAENYGKEGFKPAISGTVAEACAAYLSQDDAFCNWDKMTSNDQKLEAICSQKWLNFFGYNMLEGWNEMRRTNHPAVGASNQALESKWISRCPYPQSERNLNMDNLSTQEECDPFNSLVFWDKENPIVERTELYL